MCAKGNSDYMCICVRACVSVHFILYLVSLCMCVCVYVKMSAANSEVRIIFFHLIL